MDKDFESFKAQYAQVISDLESQLGSSWDKDLATKNKISSIETILSVLEAYHNWLNSDS